MSFYLNKDYICRVQAVFQSRKKDMASALAQEKKSNHVINKYVPLREVMYSVQYWKSKSKVLIPFCE